MTCVESSTLPGARYLDWPYRIILTKERRRGSASWIALVEELPGCEARGDTAEEATRAVREEMAGRIASALEEGRSIPQPRGGTASAGGRLELELPESLHEAVTHAAIREGMTVNQFVAVALASMARWAPGADKPEERWIGSRAQRFTGGGEAPAALRRAIALNVLLLLLVLLAAVAILAVALAHGF